MQKLAAGAGAGDGQDSGFSREELEKEKVPASFQKYLLDRDLVDILKTYARWAGKRLPTDLLLPPLKRGAGGDLDSEWHNFLTRLDILDPLIETA